MNSMPFSPTRSANSRSSPSWSWAEISAISAPTGNSGAHTNSCAVSNGVKSNPTTISNPASKPDGWLPIFRFCIAMTLWVRFEQVQQAHIAWALATYINRSTPGILSECIRKTCRKLIRYLQETVRHEAGSCYRCPMRKSPNSNVR